MSVPVLSLHCTSSSELIRKLGRKHTPFVAPIFRNMYQSSLIDRCVIDISEPCLNTFLTMARHCVLFLLVPDRLLTFGGATFSATVICNFGPVRESFVFKHLISSFESPRRVLIALWSAKSLVSTLSSCRLSVCHANAP